jgi:hypothetical protein
MESELDGVEEEGEDDEETTEMSFVLDTSPYSPRMRNLCRHLGEQEEQIDLSVLRHQAGDDRHKKQRRFQRTVEAVFKIVQGKLYKAKCTSLEQYFRDHWRISRAQVYRFLDCAVILRELADFPDTPTRERLCRSLKKLTKSRFNRRQLWQAVLNKFSPSERDMVTSTAITNIWKSLIAAGKVDPNAPAEICDTSEEDRLLTKKSLKRKSNEISEIESFLSEHQGSTENQASKRKALDLPAEQSEGPRSMSREGMGVTMSVSPASGHPSLDMTFLDTGNQAKGTSNTRSRRRSARAALLTAASANMSQGFHFDGSHSPREVNLTLSPGTKTRGKLLRRSRASDSKETQIGDQEIQSEINTALTSIQNLCGKGYMLQPMIGGQWFQEPIEQWRLVRLPIHTSLLEMTRHAGPSRKMMNSMTATGWNEEIQALQDELNGFSSSTTPGTKKSSKKGARVTPGKPRRCTLPKRNLMTEVQMSNLMDVHAALGHPKVAASADDMERDIVEYLQAQSEHRAYASTTTPIAGTLVEQSLGSDNGTPSIEPIESTSVNLPGSFSQSEVIKILTPTESDPVAALISLRRSKEAEIAPSEGEDMDLLATTDLALNSSLCSPPSDLIPISESQ